MTPYIEPEKIRALRELVIEDYDPNRAPRNIMAALDSTTQLALIPIVHASDVANTEAEREKSLSKINRAFLEQSPLMSSMHSDLAIGLRDAVHTIFTQMSDRNPIVSKEEAKLVYSLCYHLLHPDSRRDLNRKTITTMMSALDLGEPLTEQEVLDNIERVLTISKSGQSRHA